MTALPMAGPADPGSAPARFGPDAQRFRVDGMDCASCAQTVRKVVAGLDGVEAVDVSFGNATMLVAGRATP
jgi:Zn2+/Cd2+-exporting ATPase